MSNYQLSTVFGSLAAGNQPLSDFDATNGQLAAMGTLMCTASGTNSVTLTSISGYPTMTAYGNLQKVGFIAANTTTSVTTIKYSALSTLNAYLNDGTTQVGSSSIANLTAGEYYEFAYNSVLNSASGGWQEIVPQAPTGAAISIINIQTFASSGTAVGLGRAWAARVSIRS